MPAQPIRQESSCDVWARTIVQRPCAVFWGSIILVALLSAVPFLGDPELVLDFGTREFLTRGTEIGDVKSAQDAIDEEFERREELEEEGRRLRRRELGLNVTDVHSSCSAELQSCYDTRGDGDAQCDMALAKGALCAEHFEHDSENCLLELEDSMTGIKGISSLISCLNETAHELAKAADVSYSFATFTFGYWAREEVDNVLESNILKQALAIESLLVKKFAEEKLLAPLYPAEQASVGDISSDCSLWALQGACASQVGFMNRFCRSSCGTLGQVAGLINVRSDLPANAAPPGSVLPLFFPNYPSEEGVLEGSALDDAVLSFAEKCDRLVVDPYSGMEHSKFVDKDFSMCNQTTKLLLSGIRLRASTADGLDNDAFWSSRMTIFQQVIDENDQLAPDLQFVHFDRDNEGKQRNALLVKDGVMVLLVLFLVLLMTWLHTESLFVALCSFLCVLFTFPLAFFVYRVIFGIRWVGVLNMLSLFIITGLGADDTFVLHDAWVQSGVLFGKADFERRMRWTIRRSSYTMAMTSFTSSAAFFANAISSIPPLRVFGIWTGLLLLWDFALSCTFLPAAVVISETWFTRCNPKHLISRRFGQSSESSAPGSAQVAPADGTASNKEESRALDRSASKVDVNKDLKKMRFLERFFVTTFHDFMVRHSGKVVMFSCALLAFCMNLGVRVEPMKENPTIYPTSTNVGARGHLDENVLPLATYPLPVEFSFGTLPGATGYGLDPSTKSDILWDDGFDMSDPEAQEHALYVCDRLLGSADMVRILTSCFWYDFRDFSKSSGYGFPVDKARFNEAIASFAETSDGQDFVDARRIMIDPANGRLQHFSIMVLSTLDRGSLYDLAKVKVELDKWEQWVDRRNAEWAIKKRGGCDLLGEIGTTGPQSRLDETIASCGFAPLAEADFNGAGRMTYHGVQFHLYDTIISLQVLGKLAMFVSWCGAAILVTFATNNFRLGAIAAVAFALTIFETLTLMYLGGFTIGVLESIVLSILVGISCDYITHLATCVAESPAELSTFDRAQFGLSHLGITVFYGALTTMVAGFVLFFTEIIFFRLFGWFIFTVVLLAFINTLGVFTALAYWWGPTGSQGVVFASRNSRKDMETRRKSMAPNLDQFLASITKMDGSDGFAKKKRVSGIVSSGFVFIGLIVAISWIAGSGDTDQQALDELFEAAELGNGPGADPESLQIDMLFPETSLTEERTQYLCSGYEFNDPAKPTTYVTKIEVKDYKPGVVHHMVVFRLLNDASRRCPFTCFDMPETTGVVYSWAIGSSGLQLPEGTAIAIGGRSQTSSVYLQTHYDNVDETVTTDPGSGLVMYGSHVKPQYLVTTFSVGLAINSPQVVIPPGEEDTVLRARCTPKLVDNVTILAYGHHAHIIGKRIEAWQYRGDQLVGSLGVVDPYDFNLQQFLFFDGEKPVLAPGDSIEIECRYDSRSRSQTTYGGLASEDEMCNTFLMAYPQEHIVEPFCYVY